MQTGRVRWFDVNKGWGFIEKEDLKEDVFVHYSKIVGDGFGVLEDGETVQFDLVKGDKGLQAENVVRVSKSGR
jgi:CspA family cold shock protein